MSRLRGAALAAGSLFVVAGGWARTARAQVVIPLDTIEVSVASRTGAFPARSRVVQVLTAEQLSALPVRSVAEALQWLGSADVQPRSAAQNDLSLRGSTFEQVVVLVDGVRMSDPQTGHFDLDLTVPLDRVERIEVLVGPASALYGSDAMGGVVNIVTREGGTSVAARFEQGKGEIDEADDTPEPDSWRFGGSLDGALAGVGMGVSGEYATSEGHRPGTEFDVLQLHGRLAAPTARGGRITLAGGHGRRDFGANGFYAPRDSYEETRTTYASAGWSGELGPFVVRPRVTVRTHEDDFTLIRTNPAIYRNVHTSRQRGAELLVRRSVPGRPVVLAFGAEAYRDDVESDNLATPAADDALGVREEDRAAGFAEVVFLAARVTANTGLRLDWHEGFGEAWSPSISASFDATPSVRARAAWGRSFRAPTWTERFYKDPASIGDPDLQPERSWSGEVGADVALPGSGVVRATLFRRQSADLIDWVKPVGSAASVPSTVRNVESARYDGLEAAIEGVSLAGFLLDGAIATLDLDADEAAGLTSRYALKPIVEREVVGVTRPLLDRRLLLSARWQREQRRGEESYALWGARARARLLSGDLELTGTNLGNTSYKDITGFVAPGRALTVGYRVELDLDR